jgi:hypothetical protein
MRGDPWVIDEHLSTGLTRYWMQHVTIRGGTAHLANRVPFRVSEIIPPRRWRENEIFRELRSAMPLYQLNINPPPPARHRGWVITRQARDSTDADVQVVTRSLRFGSSGPHVRPARAVARRGESQYEPGGADRTGVERAGGLGRRAIGRRHRAPLGISQRTVAKHLEHIYRKLDCNDRLVAVTLARQSSVCCPHPGFTRRAEARASVRQVSEIASDPQVSAVERTHGQSCRGECGRQQ